MASYAKQEARDWAKEHMRGVANVIIPSFTRDLKDVSEQGIRHDVRKEIEYGFWGALLVSEVNITVEEYARAMEWAVDEARGRFRLIHHASFNTLEENIEAAQAAERAGAELILLSYPPTFYPASGEDIYNYTVEFCSRTNLGVMLFQVPHWGFERLHPAGIEPSIIKRLVKDVPNVVAVKAEGGLPSIGGFVQIYKMLGDEVIVTFPVEDQGLPLASLLPLQFMGTSNSEYYGPTVPKIFQLLQDGQFDQAMELWWQIHPARMANVASRVAGANALHRMLWKYQGWLNGFNGGPLRQPTMRLSPQQMQSLRNALAASGIEPTADDDSRFYIGRNPED